MPPSANQSAKDLYEFGPFRVDPEKEVLLRAGEPVPLTPKTFQILLVLVRHGREVVTKDDLMKMVWPDTFVEEANLSRNIFLLRKALGETPQDHHYIVTVPGRGYRFAEDVQLVPERELNIVAASRAKVQVQVDETKPWGWIAFAIVLLAAVAGGMFRLFLHRSPVLTEKDTIVLADFANTTGDPVFDTTLRQGMAVQLEQSPFLSLISDALTRETLSLMGQPADGRLTPEIAYDVCRRTQGAAVIDGSISNLGSQYVLGLKAVSCRSGDSLAEEQERADGKEQVLGAVDKAAAKLRKKLGESLNSVERFDTPLEQATTPSLEALQAYSLGRQSMVVKDEFAEAVPFFQRAIRLDPNFAIAYAALGSSFEILGETELGEESIRKAYDLRVRVSEQEKFYIESTYYHYVIGDREKARQIYELWAHTYPRYAGTPLRLYVLYSELGQYENALKEIREAIRLDPVRSVNYSDLVINYVNLNRPKEARAAGEEAQAKKHDSFGLRAQLYLLAFLENDAAGMAQQVNWAASKPAREDVLLELEADTASYFGMLQESEDFSYRAVASAIRAQKRERAASYEARAAVRNALSGRIREARLHLHAASARVAAKGVDLQYGTALALAFAGDSAQAQALIDELAKRRPDDSIVQFNYLPAIRAQLALDRNDPSEAIEALQAAASYEFGSPGNTGFWSCLYPAYVRGEAYLAIHKGSAAAAEFQKIIDHRGIVLNQLIGVLAHLQLGRAYAMSGDALKAKEAYQDFLMLWKDADPDIPILKQAKAEYAKLQ